MSSLRYREATGDDWALVVDSWLSSFRTSHAAGLIAMEDWRSVMTGQVNKLLARPGVKVTVACRPGAEGTRADLYGWVAVEAAYTFLDRAGRERRMPPMVLFVYVKDHYRGMGFARGLLRAAGIELGDAFDYAAKTPVVSKLRTKIPRARWNPLRARYKPKTTTPAGEDHAPEEARTVAAAKAPRP